MNLVVQIAHITFIRRFLSESSSEDSSEDISRSSVIYLGLFMSLTKNFKNLRMIAFTCFKNWKQSILQISKYIQRLLLVFSRHVEIYVNVSFIRFYFSSQIFFIVKRLLSNSLLILLFTLFKLSLYSSSNSCFLSGNFIYLLLSKFLLHVLTFRNITPDFLPSS